MKSILQPKNLIRVALFVALIGASAWAWKSAGGSFANLWLTPDQQGQRLMERHQYAEAAKHFADPLWQGVALYRDGQFKEAAAVFARVDSPEAAFDRGNALLMHGKYSDAIASYGRALQRRPGWREAQANRDLAEARRIGLGLTLIHLISIPVSNTSVNPARSTGPAVWVGGWALAQLWLFWAAPIIGAIIAGGAYRALGAEDKTMMDRVDTRVA